MCLQSLALWAETRSYRRRHPEPADQPVVPVQSVAPPGRAGSDGAQVVVERGPGEALVGLDVPAAGLLDDVRR
jgi:hypothetical protein